MPAAYNYSNTAVATTLSGSASAGATSIMVGSTTGFPSAFPYILALDFGAGAEELVKVTSAAGTTLTVVRGFGGTSAQSHSLGAAVQHVYNAQDATDFRVHETTGAGTHGVNGSLVGTTDAQTLANKTLTAPNINGAALSGTLSGSPTFSGAPRYTGAPLFEPPVGDSTTFHGATTGAVAFDIKTPIDSQGRMAVWADGHLNWGPGNAFPDVQMYRDEAGVLAVKGILRAYRDASGDYVLQVRVGAETYSRLLVDGSGKLTWGDGTGVGDTNLYRSAANSLRTDSRFQALVETSTTFTAASGFSVIEARHRKTGGVCTISIYMNVNNTITTATNSPNITDTLVGALPSGYRPVYEYETSWGSGVEGGDARIDPDGQIYLRTSDYNADISAGSNLRLSATFVL